jgi:putative flippase GtrA
MRVFKFLIAGGIGVSVNLGIFHILYVLGVPYLIGSIIALLISMAVGFTLQKYWTFQDRMSAHIRVQFIQYAALALGNLALNTGIVYVLIDKLGTHYLLAQAAGAAIVATYSFFVYRVLIFKPQDAGGEPISL